LEGLSDLRVLICGGRDYTDRTELYAELDRLHAEYGFRTVIAGGARGADGLAVEWAQSRGIATQVFAAERGTFGRKAGPLRNARMLAEGRPDLVVAFPGGRGTANMIKQATAAGVWDVNVD
jgi:predicted Rossmann-fold nucleotide-binding protein